MPLDVIIVQHAQKEPVPGDPGLTLLGHDQARQAGARLRHAGPIDELWASPLRRAIETAGHIATELGVPVPAIRRDNRIRERMNWPGEPHQSWQDFQREWERSTIDRDFRPLFGDSSRPAGERFAAFLDERHVARPGGRIIVVAHGGVTVDLLRIWFGDERVRDAAPGAIQDGIAPCRITRIVLDEGRRLLGIGLEAKDVEWESGSDGAGPNSGWEP